MAVSRVASFKKRFLPKSQRTTNRIFAFSTKLRTLWFFILKTHQGEFEGVGIAFSNSYKSQRFAYENVFLTCGRLNRIKSIRNETLFPPMGESVTSRMNSSKMLFSILVSLNFASMVNDLRISHVQALRAIAVANGVERVQDKASRDKVGAMAKAIAESAAPAASKQSAATAYTHRLRNKF